MANKQPQIVTINGVEHNAEDLTEEQNMLISHVADLERKIGSTRFQLDQLQIGHNAFMTMLTESLSKKDDLVEST
jgi:hypothetical protein